MKVVLFLCIFLAQFVDAAKVVIFVPAISNSQTTFNYRVGDLLANHGHDVTLFRVQFNPEATKGKPQSSAKEIRFKAVDDYSSYSDLKEQMNEWTYADMSFFNPKFFSVMSNFTKIWHRGCELQITNKELMKKLKDEKFDLAISHMYDFCPIGIIKVLEIPTFIWMSSGAFMDYMATAVGNPTPSSYVPNIMSSYGDRMTFVQRFKNFFGHLMTTPMVRYMNVNPENELFKREFGQDFPDLFDLASKAPLVFVNSEELLDFPRPLLHKVIYIGGIGITNPKPLKPDWQKVMDESKDGVVLFSFGSVADPAAMPAEWKGAFLYAFSKFPTFTFVWKYDGEFPEAAAVPNLILAKWAPQIDMFGHPKMKGFISHGGYNSLIEAACNGIPLLMIPLFGDQIVNRRKAERHGLGLGLDKHEVNKKRIIHILDQILLNSTYKERADRLSRMIKKKPVQGEELAVKWVDFLAEHKQLPNLEPASVDLNFVELYLLDVLATVFLALILAVYILYRIAYLYYWWCCQTSVKDKKKND